jgi:GT2 family glycosyltransferase
MDEDMHVSIVVLVHETPHEARALVESIVRHTEDDYELIVLDNGSSEGTREALATLAERTGARLVRSEQNSSFAVACNLGIHAANGAELALLNSDCLAGPRWLSNLRAAVASAEDVVAVGPRSSSAHLAQGGIWLDDTSPEGIEAFAERFNHHAPDRWFEVEWLVGFALLARRDALEAVGGFDERLRTGDGEDRDLCARLRARGGRLLCAGDTFLFHAGQRTYARAGLNRTAVRYGRTAAAAERAPIVTGALVRESNGRVFEVVDGVASHVETGIALRLIRGDREVAAAAEGDLAGLPVGPPICLAREAGTETVWLLRQGARQQVVGDPQRIRRLPGLSLAESADLVPLRVSEPLAVEAALPPVPDIPPLLPENPARIVPEHLAGADRIAADVERALSTGEGYALIQLDAHEAWLLSEGAWPVEGERRPADPSARDLRRAVLDADAVAVSPRRDAFACAALTEQVLFHLDLYPRVLGSHDIVYGLAGFDACTGEMRPGPALPALLAGRGVAVVGPLASHARRWADAIGLDVRNAIDLGPGVDEVLAALAARRERCDAVLVSGGPAPALVCTRAARELDLVAIDLGHALERMLYVRHGIEGGRELAERWALDRYVLSAAEPPPDERHPLEGRLVQAEDAAAVYYVERGSRRWLAHRELLRLFDGPVHRLPEPEVDALPLGLPMVALVGSSLGPLVLIDGRRVPLDLRIPTRSLERLELDGVPVAERTIAWFPGAP